MHVEQAFEQRNIVTAKLKEYLRGSGYTKASLQENPEFHEPT